MCKACLFICLVLAGCSEQAPPIVVPDARVSPMAAAAGDPVEGQRVASRVGCNGCHGASATGKVFDESEEFGRIVAPNLTERRELYDDAALAILLHEGRTHDGHPPWGMPIKMFQHLSHREVRDITAWLRSLPATPNPDLPPGQWSDALAKSIADGSHPWLEDLRPDEGNVPPAAPPSERLALGKHLALSTCTECHGWDLNGFDGDDAPSLIVAKAYTPSQFLHLMRTGEVAAGGKSASGLMSGVAVSRFNTMTDDEIAALKAYLDAR